MTEPSFELQLIKRNPQDIAEFAEKSLKYVEEIDNNSLEFEIRKVTNYYHVDHCWILREEEIIGLVRIIRNSFYGFALWKNIQKEDLRLLFQTIENDLKLWHTEKIEANIHNRYLNDIIEIGFKAEFSRKKMILDLTNFKGNKKQDQAKFEKYRHNHFDDIVAMYIEAYRGTIDESLGMFDKNIAESAISSIIYGDYGEFKPDLSPLIFNDGILIGGLLTTISEDNPFIIIIGVTPKFQRHGYGRQLIDWLITQSKLRNYDKIKLWVTVENSPALNLYASLGFESVHEVHTLSKLEE